MVLGGYHSGSKFTFCHLSFNRCINLNLQTLRTVNLVKHQREVGASYFDAVSTIVSAGTTTTKAIEGSTEEEQF